MTFSVIKSEIEIIGKSGRIINPRIISYKSKFIDISPSNIVNNLAEGLHKTKCKNEHNKKNNIKHVELDTKIVGGALTLQMLKMIY